MSYVVSLEAFHGPLDLLLYLIEKDQVDIYNIPIAQISDQFLDYLNDCERYDLDMIGDFLVMASYLLQLKSMLLLPDSAKKTDDESEGAEDPREELVEKLLAYKQIKAAAEFLAAKAVGDLGRVFYRGTAYQPDTIVERTVNIEDLFHAYQHLQQQLSKNESAMYLPGQDFDIEEKAAEIMASLLENHRKMALQDFFRQVGTRREALVLFLALLELIRQQKVTAVQEQTFGAIMVYA